MIFDTLNDLRSYLQTQLPDRKFQLNYLPGRDAVTTDQENSIYLTLLNISEDASAKIAYPYQQDGNRKLSHPTPALALELIVMISAFYQNYDAGLKAISDVIIKLKSKQKFSLENLTYTISLYPISIEENSNLWQAISTNILPNVIYKVRFLSEYPEPDERPIITI